MHISRLPRSCGAVCLSLGIGLFTSSNVSASDFSYGFLELSPQHLEFDVRDGGDLNAAGLGIGLSTAISDTSYLRYKGDFFDLNGATYHQSRAVFGVHQSITSRVDTFQEIGVLVSRIEVNNLAANATDFSLGLGLKMKPAELVELEARAAFAGSELDYGVGIRFLGEKELKGASLGFGYNTWNDDIGDRNVTSLDFRFNF